MKQFYRILLVGGLLILLAACKTQEPINSERPTNPASPAVEEQPLKPASTQNTQSLRDAGLELPPSAAKAENRVNGTTIEQPVQVELAPDAVSTKKSGNDTIMAQPACPTPTSISMAITADNAANAGSANANQAEAGSPITESVDETGSTNIPSVEDRDNMLDQVNSGGPVITDGQNAPVAGPIPGTESDAVDSGDGSVAVDPIVTPTPCP